MRVVSPWVIQVAMGNRINLLPLKFIVMIVVIMPFMLVFVADESNTIEVKEKIKAPDIGQMIHDVNETHDV